MALDRSAFFLSVVVQPEGEKGARLDVSDRILGFTFVDSAKKADKLTLTLDNFDLAEFDNPTFRKGGLVTVTWGYAEIKHPPVTCRIQSVKGGLQLRVEALARSIDMNKVKRSRVFGSMKISDIALQIAGEWGYSGDMLHVEDTSIMWGAVAQGGLTDAQFLAKHAKREGFQFYVDWSGFHFHQPNLGQRPRRVLEYFTSETGDIKDDFDVENDITARAGTVVVHGRNPMPRKDFAATADNASTKRQGLAPNPEAEGETYVMDRSTGAVSVRQRVAGEHAVTAAPTEAAAKRHADAAFRGAQLGTVKMKMNIIGDPAMLAKSVVEVRGLGKRLSGNYYVSSVTHKGGGKSAYECELEMRRDGHSEKGTPTSKAKVNTQKAATSGPQLTTSLNERDGQPTQTWRNTQGQAVGGPNDIPQSGGT